MAREFWKLTVGVTSIVMSSPSSVSVIALITRGSDCPVDHVEVFYDVEVQLREPRTSVFVHWELQRKISGEWTQSVIIGIPEKAT